MLNKWMFDKKKLRQTPSQSDGVDYLTEILYRKEGAKFIQAAVKELRLTHDTMATGCVFFHRFFMFHSFEKFNRWVMAASCLFLAGKVEETPKLSKDIVRTAKHLLSKEQFTAFALNPVDEMLLYEKILLQTVKFDFNIIHPYKFILKYAKQFRGEKNRKSDVVQMAWNYCNESFCTPVSLHYTPDVIAGALLTLSAKRCKFSISLSKDVEKDDLYEQIDAPWWGYLIESSTSVDDIEEIQNIMQRLSEEKADLYEDEVDVTACDSPGNEDNELSDVDIEDVAPPPPPRDNKRHIPGLEPSQHASKRAALRDSAPSNGSKADSIPMLGESHPPPPPAPPSRRRESGRHSRDNPGIYDPSRGFL
ncbi:cyclin-K-like isoform X2 [Bolinopsis microptera]|uniref:cyclin-K-like isoform X2 n=1 Tax=Bolinopsis microptera TaxID=2820187 RepID=UPI003078D179